MQRRRSAGAPTTATSSTALPPRWERFWPSTHDPGSGFFALRAINVAAGAGPIDVYLTAPGADLTNAAPVLSNVPYGSATNFLSVATGATFEIRITPTGTKQIIYDSTPKVFAEHSGTAIVAYSKGGGTLVNVALLNSDGAGTGSIADSLTDNRDVAAILRFAATEVVPRLADPDIPPRRLELPADVVRNATPSRSGPMTPGVACCQLLWTFLRDHTSVRGSVQGAHWHNLPPATGGAGVRSLRRQTSPRLAFSSTPAQRGRRQIRVILRQPDCDSGDGDGHMVDFNLSARRRASCPACCLSLPTSTRSTSWPIDQLAGVVTQDDPVASRGCPASATACRTLRRQQPLPRASNHRSFWHRREEEVMRLHHTVVALRGALSLCRL
jgi:hypothetical protein